jgi:hypothetical protein
MAAMIALGVVVVAIVGGVFAMLLWPRSGNRRDTLLFLVGIGIGAIFAFQGSLGEIAGGWDSALAAVGRFVGAAPAAGPPSGLRWPPAVNEPYPDLQLIDQDGRRTSLFEFSGKVVLIEPVGMPCRACIAFAGGHQRGPFDGVAPQRDLKSIEHYAREYARVDLNDERLVVIQILFYDNDLAAPTAADARRWAEHFRMDRSQDRVVLAAEPYLLGPATHAMIPGFQLLDRDLVLRYDSTGHHPRHDLYRDLLPAIRTLLDE